MQLSRMTAPVLAAIVVLMPHSLSARQVKVGAVAPDFTLPASAGHDKQRLSQFQGHPVIISFWATWCPPCRKELPELAALADANRARGLVVLSVNEELLEVDINGRGVYRKKSAHDSTLTAFLTAVSLPFPVLLDDGVGAVWNRYSAGHYYLPAIFFIDSTGVVRATHDQLVSSEVLASGLRAILPRP